MVQLVDGNQIIQESSGLILGIKPFISYHFSQIFKNHDNEYYLEYDIKSFKRTLAIEIDFTTLSWICVEDRNFLNSLLILSLLQDWTNWYKVETEDWSDKSNRVKKIINGKIKYMNEGDIFANNNGAYVFYGDVGE